MYMSPEQLNGDSPKPAQDVYSFAAMVYECINGEPPFCRGNIEHQIENKSPKALPGSIGIGEIVMRGLSKSPKDRPESCVEVLGTASTSIGNKCLSIKTCFWKRKNVRRSLSVLIPMLGLLGFLIIFVNGALPFFSEPDAEKAEYMAPNFISGRDYSDGDCRTFTLPGNVKMEMVYVGPGQFLMGTDIQPHPKHKDDLMPHQVKITKGYWIGKYPITQKQWNALVSALDIKFKYYRRNESSQRNGNDREAPIAEFSSRHPGGNLERNAVKGMDTSDFPMEDISWSDCDILVNALNEHETAPLRWRMPTEAEWEFAARGGNKSRGYLYAGSDDLKAVGWYAENSGDSGLLEDQVTSRRQLKLNNCRVHSVKEKDVGNELGVVGMSGNVWEWCRDAKDSDVPFYEICAAKGVVADPCCISTNEYRVLRGGSYRDISNACRITTRHAKSVDSRKELHGFRLCCFEL